MTSKEAVTWKVRWDSEKCRMVFSDLPAALTYYHARYPAVDVEAELVDMNDWLRDAKPKTNYHRFILNWLRKARRTKLTTPPKPPLNERVEPKYKPIPKLDMDEMLRRGIDEGPPGWEKPGKKG